MSQTTFALGRIWRCERQGKPAFDFVIVDKGSCAGLKKCRLACESPSDAGHGMIVEYSHVHIKRCAKLLPVGSKAFGEST